MSPCSEEILLEIPNFGSKREREEKNKWAGMTKWEKITRFFCEEHGVLHHSEELDWRTLFSHAQTLPFYKYFSLQVNPWL